MTEPKWLTWARQIQAIAQTGRHYTSNGYDRERYEQLESLATEILAQYSDDTPREVIREIFKTEDGYATPKTDMRGVVFNQQNKILLVQEKMDHDKWTLPGGWADVNTPPSRNVEREVLEEAGYMVKAKKILAYYDRQLHDHPPFMFHTYKVFVLCELLNENSVESPQGNLETEVVDWFAEADLPPESEISVGRVTRKQLLRFFDHARNPNWETEFD